MKITHQSTVDVTYRVDVIRGGNLAESRTGKNMVMDNGLNDLGNYGLGNTSFAPGSPFTVARFGSGTGPLRRGSSGITFTTSGSSSITVTASAGFFEAADVGRILKLDTGEELRITAFTSGTVATATSSAASFTQNVAGTIHYVNQSGLSAHIATIGDTFLERGSQSYNSTTYTYAQIVAGDSPAATAAATIAEMGWFRGYRNAGTVYASAMSGRVLLPSPIGIQVGDIVRLTLTINMVMQADAVSVSAGDFTGITRFWGDTSVGSGLANALGRVIQNYSGAVDLGSIHTTSPDSAATGFLDSKIATGSNPEPGVFIDTATFGVSESNGTINTIRYAGVWFHKLTAPFVKNSTITLTLSFTKTLGRTLVN